MSEYVNQRQLADKFLHDKLTSVADSACSDATLGDRPFSEDMLVDQLSQQYPSVVIYRSYSTPDLDKVAAERNICVRWQVTTHAKTGRLLSITPERLSKQRPPQTW
jgi:hypothetical protein